MSSPAVSAAALTLLWFPTRIGTIRPSLFASIAPDRESASTGWTTAHLCAGRPTRSRRRAKGSRAVPASATCLILAFQSTDARRGAIHREATRTPQPPGLSTLSKRAHAIDRSEEHTSELQSQSNLACRL